ncbi:MAG: quinone oxidoreductase [Thermoanaerobaculia bacterium]
MHAIRVSAPGGPEILEHVTLEKPKPREGEALARVEAIGVNYIDIYHRTGTYAMTTPFIPGSEAAGVVEEVGPGAAGIRPGDRVAWAMVPGSYAEHAAVPAEKLVTVPPGVDFPTAAASLLQGMTAHYLLVSTYSVQNGDAVLIHAAAGGVGGLLVQMARQRGARVFATASTTKLATVRDLGADSVIDYTTGDFEAEVLRATNGAGVRAVYDGVGRATFDKSLNCVGRRGVLALFGQASGPVPPFDPSRLAKRAIYLTRPSLAHYVATREELLWRAGELFEEIVSGKIRIRIDRELPLRDAAQAHRLLEGRQTEGKLLLIP